MYFSSLGEVKTKSTIHDRFKLAMFPSLITGLLTNTYIISLLIVFNATHVLWSPIIGSLVFVFCYFLLRSDRMTSKLAFLLTCYTIAIEIAVHTHVLGWDCGFFYFIFLLPMVFLLNTTWKRWMIGFFNGSILLIFLWLRYTYYGDSGTHPFPEDWVANLNFLNALAVGSVVLVILIFFSRTIYSKDEAIIAANSELERQNKEILDQHDHLQILLKEVHHRVKNNLQIISSLMSLQARTVKDEAIVGILNESRRRVEAIALIHQKLYQGDHANQVNFKSYLDELMKSQHEMHPHVEYFVETDEVVLILDTAVPLGLIVSEMITNSIKHGFYETQEPKINVSLSQIESGYKLIVSDNGCGLDSDFDLKKPLSLGTEIIVALVDQIDATISHSNDSGAEFIIIFHDDIKEVKV